METMFMAQLIEVLLVEDSEPDARLTIEALKEAKIKNRLWIVPDGVEAMRFVRREVVRVVTPGTLTDEALLERATVLALGPGLGQSAWGHALWYAALSSGKPNTAPIVPTSSLPR